VVDQSVPTTPSDSHLQGDDAMPFPEQIYSDGGGFIAAYRDALIEAWQSIDVDAVSQAADLLDAAIRGGHTIFACGNGGSAAIANHLLCDFLKGVQTDTQLRPRVTSLASHLELMTAIANDIAYEEVFAYQLRTLGRTGDVLLTISSSGNSENIVRAVRVAHENGLRSIAMTGFDGGRSAGLAEVNLHVKARNYGIVEDVHQSMMHSLAQFLRQRAMPAELAGQRVF
jgi:D-sedoheptulose 7-phosphate isomerase